LELTNLQKEGELELEIRKWNYIEIYT